MPTLALLSLLFLSAEVRAQYIPPQGGECPDPDAQSVDLNCQFVFKEQAERELNQVFKQLLAAIDGQEAKRLRSAQRAWLAFRDADVALVVEHYGEGGSLGRGIAARRSFELTRARIADLRRRLAGSDRW